MTAVGGRSRAIKVRVLFENSGNAETKGFGPGKLLLACVADERKVEPWTLQSLIQCRPTKGDSNLLNKLRDEQHLLPAKGAHVFAVFDNDKIRNEGHIRLPATATVNDLEDQVKRFIHGIEKRDESPPAIPWLSV